jgi:hypothetical protein
MKINSVIFFISALVISFNPLHGMSQTSKAHNSSTHTYIAFFTAGFLTAVTGATIIGYFWNKRNQLKIQTLRNELEEKTQTTTLYKEIATKFSDVTLRQEKLKEEANATVREVMRSLQDEWLQQRPRKPT